MKQILIFVGVLFVPMVMLAQLALGSMPDEVRKPRPRKPKYPKTEMLTGRRIWPYKRMVLAVLVLLFLIAGFFPRSGDPRLTVSGIQEGEDR